MVKVVAKLNADEKNAAEVSAVLARKNEVVSEDAWIRQYARFCDP